MHNLSYTNYSKCLSIVGLFHHKCNIFNSSANFQSNVNVMIANWICLNLKLLLRIIDITYHVFQNIKKLKRNQLCFHSSHEFKKPDGKWANEIMAKSTKLNLIEDTIYPLHLAVKLLASWNTSIFFLDEKRHRMSSLLWCYCLAKRQALGYFQHL